MTDRSADVSKIPEDDGLQESNRSTTDSRTMILMVGSLTETVTIGGGLWWIMAGGERLSLLTRVVIVSVIAVLISGGLLAVVLRQVNRDLPDKRSHT